MSSLLGEERGGGAARAARQQQQQGDDRVSAWAARDSVEAAALASAPAGDSDDGQAFERALQGPAVLQLRLHAAVASAVSCARTRRRASVG